MRARKKHYLMNRSVMEKSLRGFTQDELIVLEPINFASSCTPDLKEGIPMQKSLHGFTQDELIVLEPINFASPYAPDLEEGITREKSLRGFSQDGLIVLEPIDFASDVKTEPAPAYPKVA